MSFTEWLQMGGYAGYVWSAFGLTLIVLVLNIVFARAKLDAQLVLVKRHKLQVEDSQ